MTDDLPRRYTIREANAEPHGYQTTSARQRELAQANSLHALLQMEHWIPELLCWLDFDREAYRRARAVDAALNDLHRCVLRLHVSAEDIRADTCRRKGCTEARHISRHGKRYKYCERHQREYWQSSRRQFLAQRKAGLEGAPHE